MSDVADPDSFQQALGPLRTASLSAGPLRYRDHGSGVPVVFLAGLVLPSGFWRRVVPLLTQPVRAIVPDLPLGAHTIPMRRDADLSPTAIADLIPELLDTLDVSEAVIIGNDTGGAIAKLLATRHPERVSALVLTPCECFENFLPPIYRYLQVLAHMPGAPWPLCSRCASRPSADCRSPSAGSPSGRSTSTRTTAISHPGDQRRACVATPPRSCERSAAATRFKRTPPLRASSVRP